MVSSGTLLLCLYFPRRNRLTTVIILEKHSIEVHNSRRPLNRLTLTLTLTLTFTFDL